MCTLTQSVRLLERFFRAYPHWYIALHATKYRALNDVFYHPQLWEDIYTFRVGFLPIGLDAPSWKGLLESEHMSAALRVLEHRLHRL